MKRFPIDVKDDTDDVCVGIFTYTDIPNNNGFIVSKEVMRKAVEEYKQVIREDKAIGTLDIFGCINTKEPNFSLSSHKVIDIYENDNSFGAEIQILDTERGNMVKELIDSGLELEFNAKYKAKVNEDKILTDIHIVSIDLFYD